MVQECVSKFISFITDKASDKCQCEKCKTINDNDLLWAMTTLVSDDQSLSRLVFVVTASAVESEGSEEWGCGGRRRQ